MMHCSSLCSLFVPGRNHTRRWATPIAITQRLIFACIFSISCDSVQSQAQFETSGNSAVGPNAAGWGHSHFGANYDEGPRARPWEMDGIGKTHFPVSSTHPEVQKWFDQGHTLLHGYWYFEAERSFRWCLKLDPDCAMAYWGLSRCCQQDPERSAGFLNQALDRKHLVSDRERAYLEIWDAKRNVAKLKSGSTNDPEQKEALRKAIEEYTVRFDRLLIDYPKDIEARALYWLDFPGTESVDGASNQLRYARDRVLQEVLASDPEHVGALHYRIHNWDGPEGGYVLDTCLHLRRIAPRAGHLLHMPGHVFTEMGLWHEAAIAMDSATRVEKEYMHRRMILPEQNWNYIHNLNYLCYIQEQLGMYQDALLGARQLMAGPRVSRDGIEATFENYTSTFPLIRLLVKYQKWNIILDQPQKVIHWNNENPVDVVLRMYARTLALIGTGKTEEAAVELDSLKTFLNEYTPDSESDAAGLSPESLRGLVAVDRKLQELEGMLTYAKGHRLEGLRILADAAQEQADNWRNDPPLDANYLYNTLGDMYLEMGSATLAAEAYQKTLQRIRNDGFALSGLVRAYGESGQMEKAKEALSVLKVVWSDADLPNDRFALAMATGIETSAHVETAIEERNYGEFLQTHGPSLWSPARAPEFTLPDSSGTNVSLADFQGKNVIVIFYQGGTCLHCMEQMQAIHQRMAEFEELNTAILAISKDDQEAIRNYESTIRVKLLSDPEFSVARKYSSYDDFEEIELHSTFLIDPLGRVHFAKTGGDPFMDFGFLLDEVRRLNETVVPHR